MTTLSGLLLIFKIIFRDIKFHNFFLDVQYFIQTNLALVSTKLKAWNYNIIVETTNPQCCSFQEDHIDHEELELTSSTAEVKMVMDKLGIEFDTDCEFFCPKKVLALFEEEEPTLEEVREAFDVFDENKDGFIDKTELQRVLYSLGYEQVSELEECKRMIGAFDENGDGVIDLTEFVKLMDKCI